MTTPQLKTPKAAKAAKPPKPKKARAPKAAKRQRAERQPGERRVRWWNPLSWLPRREKRPKRPRIRPEDILRPYDHSTGVVAGVKIWHVAAVACVLCIPWGFYFALLVPYLLPVFVAPVMLVLAVVIWALPNSPVAPTRTMNWLFFAYFIFLIAWPSYLAIVLPGLPWITWIRLFSFPMVILFAISLSISQDFRRDLYDSLKAAPSMWKMVVALTVVQLFSIPLSAEIGVSIQKYIVAIVNWTAVFFISAYVFRKPGRAERWAMVMWGLAVFVTLIAVVEYRQQRVLWAGHIPSFLAVQDATVIRILSGASRFGAYRAQSTFTTPLGLSEYLALTLPFVLYFVAGQFNTVVRGLALASVVLLLYGNIITDSRLGIVGSFISIMLYILLWALQQWRGSRGSFVGPAIAMAYPVLFCMAVASTFVVGRIREKVWGSGQYQASNEGRMEQVRRGLPMIMTHPIGHGIGAGADALGYTNAAGVGTIDSYYLLIGLDYGIPGFFIYYAIFVIAIYYALKYSLDATSRPRELELLAPAAISLINFFIIKSIFSNDENHPIAFILAGMVTALAARVRVFDDGQKAAARPHAEADSVPSALPAYHGGPPRPAAY